MGCCRWGLRRRVEQGKEGLRGCFCSAGGWEGMDRINPASGFWVFMHVCSNFEFKGMVSVLTVCKTNLPKA